MSGGADIHPITAALDNPQAAPVLAEPGAPIGEIGSGAGSGFGGYELRPFPPACPIRPLGVLSDTGGSQKCFYLDVNGQLVSLEAGNRHGKNGLIHLFGEGRTWLYTHFPQWSAPKKKTDRKTGEEIILKPSEIVGFDQAEASEALIAECVRLGVFDPSGRMRGRGAHRQGDHGLVLHFGDKLLVSDLKPDGRIKRFTWTDTGLYAGYVYPSAMPIPRPHHEPVTGKAAIKLLKLLRTWHWKRELLDPRLALGAIAAGFVGGALPWRPNVWITGQRGTGKSTFNGQGGVVHQLFGEGVFRTGNASAAAIRQTLKNSTVPVMIDEIEAGADNRRVNEVIELARVASSGDTMHRGGQDHQAHEFTLRSPFWFSSINIPPLAPQDRSRLAILELKPLRQGTPPPVLSEWGLSQIGRELQRRMIDGWHRLEATKAKYHLALAAIGHDARACDQFGTLLACADVAMDDHSTDDGLPDDQDVAEWAALCRPDRMAEITEATADHVACLQHLLTSMVQSRGGEEREQLGSWIDKALAAAMEPILADAVAADKNAERLRNLGLKLVNAKFYPEERDTAGKVIKASRWGAQEFHQGEPGYLAIAGQHQGLDKLYEGTSWRGIVRQALERFPGTLTAKVKYARGVSLTSALVPLWAFVDEDELPNASKRKAAEEWVREQSEGAEA